MIQITPGPKDAETVQVLYHGIIYEITRGGVKRFLKDIAEGLRIHPFPHYGAKEVTKVRWNLSSVTPGDAEWSLTNGQIDKD